MHSVKERSGFLFVKHRLQLRLTLMWSSVMEVESDNFITLQNTNLDPSSSIVRCPHVGQLASLPLERHRRQTEYGSEDGIRRLLSRLRKHGYGYCRCREPNDFSMH